MSTTTHITGNLVGVAAAAEPARAVPVEVFDLFALIKKLEQGDWSWPGGDTVSALCAWFIDHGIDPEAQVSSYRPAPPQPGRGGRCRDGTDGASRPAGDL
jgi:hypothetical protein